MEVPEEEDSDNKVNTGLGFGHLAPWHAVSWDVHIPHSKTWDAGILH